MSPVLKKFHSDLDFDHSDLEARTVRRLKKKGKAHRLVEMHVADTKRK